MQVDEELDPIKIHEFAGKILESLPDTISMNEKIAGLKVAAASLEQVKVLMDCTRMLAKQLRALK